MDELSRLSTHYGFIDSGRMVKEMSAGELEARCRKSVRIEVSDTKAIARVLDKMGVEYSIASDTAADIFADVQATELIEKAAKELIHLRDEIAAEKDGIPPKTLIVLCALTNAAYQRPDGVYVVPITALKD